MPWTPTLTDVTFITDDVALPPRADLIVEVTHKGITDITLVTLGKQPTAAAIRATADVLHAKASRQFKDRHGIHPSSRCSSKVIGIYQEG